jgi:hypothetical protein
MSTPASPLPPGLVAAINTAEQAYTQYLNDQKTVDQDQANLAALQATLATDQQTAQTDGQTAYQQIQAVDQQLQAILATLPQPSAPPAGS